MSTSSSKDEPDLVTDEEKLTDWRRQIERRSRGLTGRVARGGGRAPRAVAAGAWQCEGQWQCDDQLDIWQCLDEVALDTADDGVEQADTEPDHDQEERTA